MSRFFVGQRVRITHSNNWPELAGEEGRIEARSPHGGSDGSSEWVVSPDIWGSFVAPRRGDRGANKFAPNSRQLEPILPSGAAPSEYSLAELLDECRAGEGVAA